MVDLTQLRPGDKVWAKHPGSVSPRSLSLAVVQRVVPRPAGSRLFAPEQIMLNLDGLSSVFYRLRFPDGMRRVYGQQYVLPEDEELPLNFTAAV